VAAILTLLLAALTPSPDLVRVDVLGLLVPQAVVITPLEGTIIVGGRRIGPGERASVIRRGTTVQLELQGGRLAVSTCRLECPAGGRLRLLVRGRQTLERVYSCPLEVTAVRGRLRIIALERLEALVASAVAAEMDGVTEESALGAAAVTIRSFVVASLGRHRTRGFDLCDTSHCVVSRGIVDSATARAAERAAAVTQGAVLTSGGAVIRGYCSACCGGLTLVPSDLWPAAADGGYARVECRWCTDSKRYRWQRQVTVQDVHGVVGSLIGRRGRASWSVSASRDARGVVRAVIVADGTKAWRLRADELRMAVGRRLGWDAIPGPRFRLERVGEHYLVDGQGHGHAVGLCLSGATSLGRHGYSTEQILAVYFPRAKVAWLSGPGPGV
jgi:stage II sporulation protein D